MAVVAAPPEGVKVALSDPRTPFARRRSRAPLRVSFMVTRAQPPRLHHPLTRSGDFGVLLISAAGDQIGVEMDVGPISTNCVYLSEILGTGEFARSQIGDQTISVPLTFNSDEVYGNGTLTLNRSN